MSLYRCWHCGERAPLRSKALPGELMGASLCAECEGQSDTFTKDDAYRGAP